MAYRQITRWKWLFVMVWGLCSSLFGAPTPGELPEVVILPDGCIVAVWQSNDGDSYSIQSACYDAFSQVWQSPVQLSDSNEKVFGQKMYSNSSGQIIVTWLQQDTAHGVNRLKSTMRLDPTTWSTPAFLSPTDEQVEKYQLQIGDGAQSGSLIAIWNSVNMDTRTFRIWSSTATFGGSWSNPVQLS